MNPASPARLATGWLLRRGRLLATLLAGVILLGSTTTPASAHNTLLSSTPADGEAVPRTPQAVVLVFDESAIALGAQVLVTGPSGPVQTGSPTVTNNSVRQQLADNAPAGVYTVAWRVTSADGHPVTGTFHFTAQLAGEGKPAPGSSPAPAADRSNGHVARNTLVLVGALILGTGAGALLRRRRRSQPSESSSPPQ